MNTFMPAAPGSRSSSPTSAALSRVPPTQKAKSQCMRPVARATLSASASALVVSGWVLGISKTAVTPPSTAAREPLSKSSLCSRPGSRKCTWLSIDARQDVQAAAIDRLAGGSLPESPIAAMRPPLTPMSRRPSRRG